MRDPSYDKKSPLSRLRQLATTALPVLSLSILLACSQENHRFPRRPYLAPAPPAATLGGERPSCPA